MQRKKSPSKSLWLMLKWTSGRGWLCACSEYTSEYVPWSIAGYGTRNGEKLSSSQTEPGQIIKPAVASFPSISCVTFCQVAL